MEINSNLLQIQSGEERLLLDVCVCVLHSLLHIVHALHNAYSILYTAACRVETFESLQWRKVKQVQPMQV